MSDPNLSLREYTDEDHERTWAWLQDPDLRRLTGTTAAPTRETHKRWIEQMRSRRDVALWAIAYEGEHIGSFYLTNIDLDNSRAEIHMFLGPRTARGKGIGKAVFQLIKQHAFQELGLHRLYGFPFEYNTASIRALLATGYRIEGVMRDHRKVDGVFCNVLVMGCLDTDG